MPATCFSFSILSTTIGALSIAALQPQQDMQQQQTNAAVYLTLASLRDGSLCCRLNDSSVTRQIDCTGCGLLLPPLLHPELRPHALLLSGNRIRSLQPGAFANASGLRRLDLSANPRLARLAEGSLTGAEESLLELDLSGTGLSDTTCYGLAGLRHLKRLRMAGMRQLDSLPAQLADLPMLQELDVSSGGLSVVRAGDFYKLKNLKSLRLTQTQLYRIEAAAFDQLAASLRRLAISAPTLARTLVVDQDSESRGAWGQVLRRLPNLWELQLSSDPPVLNCSDDDSEVRGLTGSVIWPAVWPLRMLQRLILDGNCVRQAPPSLGRELLPDLQELRLVANPFVCICSPPTFVLPSGVSGAACASLEEKLLAKVDTCPTLRQQATPTPTPALQLLQPPPQPLHTGLVVATSVVTSLTFLSAIAIVSVILYYRRIAAATSSALSVATSSETAKTEVYAEYERPIAAGSCSGVGGAAYEVLAEPSPMPLPTRARRFFRRSERPSPASEEPSEPPPLPPRTQPQEIPQAQQLPSSSNETTVRASSSGNGGVENAAYSPAEEKGQSDSLVIVGSF